MEKIIEKQKKRNLMKKKRNKRKFIVIELSLINLKYIVKSDNFKKNMKLIIIYMIGAFFYYLSLRPIKGPKLTCFKKRNLACFTILSRLVIASSSIITFNIYMILYNKIYSKYHLINIIIIYSNFIYKDHNNEIQKHGLFNFIGFIIFAILFF